MKSFEKLKDDYKSGKISKEIYIEKAYAETHAKIHELSNQLRSGKVRSITISQNDIIAEIEDLNFKYAIVPGDIRNCVLESINFDGFEPMDSWMIYDTLKAISSNASMNKRAVFYDVGSNNGWYSLYASTLPNVEIHAFEPVTHTYQNLLLNLQLNRVTNVHPHNFGLSDQAGFRKFYIDPKVSGKSSLAKLPGHTDNNSESFRLEILDHIIEVTGNVPDFVKIDVEGAEFLVIKGGIRLIKENQPIIFIELLRKWGKEFGYHPQQVLNILFELGYRCFFSNERRQLEEILKINDDTRATNFIFLHDKHNCVKEYLNESNCKKKSGVH